MYNRRLTLPIVVADYNMGSEYVMLTMADSAIHFLNAAQRTFAKTEQLTPE